MKTIMATLVLCSAAVAQESYQAVPYGRRYEVPAQVYVPMQTYQVGPPRYVPRDPYYDYRVNPYVIRPRGVWGVGPVRMGYYW
jgi:hypothetical protein